MTNVWNRLNKDLKEVRDIQGVRFDLTDDPSSTVIVFHNGTVDMDGAHKLPSKFLVKVSRYYPHVCPTITCLDEEFCSSYIEKDGNVKHEKLHEGWSAIGTLRTIVEILLSIRNQWRTASIQCMDVTDTPTVEKYGIVDGGGVTSPESSAYFQCLAMDHC